MRLGLAPNRLLHQRVAGRVERVMARHRAMQRPGVDQLAAERDMARGQDLHPRPTLQERQHAPIT